MWIRLLVVALLVTFAVIATLVFYNPEKPATDGFPSSNDIRSLKIN